MKKIQIGFSPCPNDTFIFDALVNNKIDTDGLEFEPVMEDVQTLNRWAMGKKLPVTKLSYGVLPLVLDKYSLLNSGSALGRGVGPLLISQDQNMTEEEIDSSIVAIPGEQTTAHLLFSMAYPGVKKKIFLRYDEIEEYVMQGKGPGVIIHENRFTYQDKGLKKIIDLGDYWEKQTGDPIPLGGIVIDKNIDIETKYKIDGLIKESIGYSFSQYPDLSHFIRSHAQEMNEEVMRKHIDLYVNEFSLNLGDKGTRAVKRMIAVFDTMHEINREKYELF